MTTGAELDSDAAWSVNDVRMAEASLMARLPEGVLMSRAAHGLARACIRLLAERSGVYGARVTVLVGRGNNGGDALFAGALLARRGAAVTAVVAASHFAEVHIGGLAALRAAGGLATLIDSGQAAVFAVSDLIVDGLVGIGGWGPLREPAAGLAVAAMAARRDRNVPVVAVDIPSGVDADTGGVDSAVPITADLTVTFGCLKPGLLLAPGAWHVGRIELVDIGLAGDLTTGPAARRTAASTVQRLWPIAWPDDDKYRRGVLGIVAGSPTYPGAALLAVGGALAGPVGMVRFVGRAASAVVNMRPEVVATTDIEDAGQVQAWAVGPGMGTDEAAERRLQWVLRQGLPTVIDSDGITMLARQISSESVVPGRFEGTVVLTPHEREFTRLADALRGSGDGPDSAVHPLAQAQHVADALHATVLLKGSHTIVASPGRVPFVNPTGTPALATAGSGDVLSGLVGALLAAGMAEHEAAASAAYVHGLAGIEAERSGPVTASRLRDALPIVVARFCA